MSKNSNKTFFFANGAIEMVVNDYQKSGNPIIAVQQHKRTVAGGMRDMSAVQESKTPALTKKTSYPSFVIIDFNNLSEFFDAPAKKTPSYVSNTDEQTIELDQAPKLINLG